eukprot:2927602-Rhodomonas_salina.1
MLLRASTFSFPTLRHRIFLSLGGENVAYRDLIVDGLLDARRLTLVARHSSFVARRSSLIAQHSSSRSTLGARRSTLINGLLNAQRLVLVARRSSMACSTLVA